MVRNESLAENNRPEVKSIMLRYISKDVKRKRDRGRNNTKANG